MHVISVYVLCPSITHNVVWYLVYNEYCTWNTTSDREQIIIFNLVLQVYCSPSLKELLYNPVMPLLTCNNKRK